MTQGVKLTKSSRSSLERKVNRLQELEIVHGIGPLAELAEDLRVVQSTGGYFHISVSKGGYLARLRVLGVDTSKIDTLINVAFYRGTIVSFNRDLKKAIVEGSTLKFGDGTEWDFSRRGEI